MSDYDPNYVPQKHYFLIAVKAVVFNSEGKILLLKRSEKLNGKWNLIGGSLEDEDPIEGLKREAQEEGQIELSDIKPIKINHFIEGDDNVLVIFFQAKTNTDQLTLNWEHDEYKWLTIAEALTYPISDTLKQLLKTFTN